MALLLSTYFYWFLILNIKAFRAVEYVLLRIFRRPINWFIIYIAAKFGIIMIPEWKNQKIGRKDENIEAELGDLQQEPDLAFVDENTAKIYIRVKNPETFIRIINEGTIGVGEAFMENWFESNQVELLGARLYSIFGKMKPHPVVRLRDWINVNAWEFPWEERCVSWLNANPQSNWFQNLIKYT